MGEYKFNDFESERPLTEEEKVFVENGKTGENAKIIFKRKPYYLIKEGNE